MTLSQELRHYQAQLNRRFWTTVVPLTLAALPALLIIQCAVGPGVLPKWVWVTITAVLPVPLVAYVAWAYIIRPKRLGHHCPACHQVFTGHVAQTVMDTGRCPRCRADVP